MSGGYAASSDTLPQEETDRAQPTFGLLESPLIGNGFGSFDVYSPLFVDPTNPSTTGTTSSAHNLPLQVLYEGGLIGFLAVLAATWIVVRRCWALAIAPALVTIGVDSIFDTFAYVVQVSWVLGLVFAVGLQHRLAHADAPSEVTGP